MNRFLLAAVITTTLAAPATAQVAGSIGYAQNGARARAEQRERENRTLPKDQQPPSKTSTFVTADVLMNVKADEYVAVFGLAREAPTVAESGRKMDALVKDLTDAIKKLGVANDALAVDFIAQVRVFGYEIQGDVAREKFVGFETKKNLSVRFAERALLDKILVAAAGVEVHDLIKVDYVVRDLRVVQDRLMEEAAAIVKRKVARDEALLGIKLVPPAQIFAEKYATHYPTALYDSYTAAEAEEFTPLDRQRYAVQSTRKGRTFVFNGLDGDGFDTVVNPVILEPVVQFTLHLKVKYEVEQAKAR